MAALRSSSVKPDILDFSSPATPANPMKFPCASYTLIPSASISFAAAVLGLARASSMDLRLVPASELIMPLLAKADSVPTVSSILRPKELATMPHWDRPRPRSWAEPWAAAAPDASASATRPASEPVRLNWASVELISSAASATCMPSEAARFSAPVRPPARMSLVDRPALASSTMAFADSVALYTVLAPASMAACLSCSMPAALVSTFALTELMAWSKSA